MGNLNEVQELIKKKMQGIAEDVDSKIPEGFGFVVLVFPFSKDNGNQLMYTSNANREDVCHEMIEFIKKQKIITGTILENIN